jgi:hypothetical protein
VDEYCEIPSHNAYDTGLHPLQSVDKIATGADEASRKPLKVMSLSKSPRKGKICLMSKSHAG